MCFFFSSRRRHTRWNCDWSSDVCSSDLFCKRNGGLEPGNLHLGEICKMAHAINNPAGTASIKSDSVATTRPSYQRSEERRVGKERRYRRASYQQKESRLNKH